LPSSHVSPLPTTPSPQRTAQTPLVQLWPLAQAAATKPRPSVAQIWRLVALAHTAVAVPGTQLRGVQVPAPVQE
jgi:hypothetical protein